MVVRNQLLHTVYQLHLGELVLLQANYFECPEAPFWNVVKQVTEQSFYRLRDNFKSRLAIKSLTSHAFGKKLS